MSRNSLENFSTTIIEIAWRVILIFIAIYVAMIGVQRAYSFGHGILYDHAMELSPGTDETLEISDDDEVSDIADKLISLGLIDNVSAFTVQSRLYGTTFVSGTYELNTSMTLSEILSYLNEEGQKISELKDKNLITESQEESDEDSDVIGGDEDVEDDLDNTPSSEEETEILGVGDE